MTRERAINLVLLGALPAIALWGAAAEQPFTITLATKVAIFALAGVGLNLVLGYGGLVSFGHAAFFGIGGYAAGILASHVLNYTPLVIGPWEFAGTRQMLIIWPVAMAAAALAALVIGALSLRTTGIFFIMITLAFGQMFFYFAISWPAYGGEDGLPIYLRNAFPGLDTMQPLAFFWLAYGVLALALGFVALLMAAPFGMSLQAARQNRERLRALGIEPYGILLTAFAVSGALTGLAGALYADLNRFVSPAMLSWQTSGEIIVFIILGGTGRLFGPVAGAGLYIALEYVLGGVSDYWQFLLGLLLLFVVLFARGGLIGLATGESRDG